jgi:acetoin utilization deacetylase AcuC-like enzyme
MSEDYSKGIHRVGDESAFMPGGFEVAALAAGGAITATEAVLEGKVENAYVLCRWACMWASAHAHPRWWLGVCLAHVIKLACSRCYGWQPRLCCQHNFHGVLQREAVTKAHS